MRLGREKIWNSFVFITLFLQNISIVALYFSSLHKNLPGNEITISCWKATCRLPVLVAYSIAWISRGMFTSFPRSLYLPAKIYNILHYSLFHFHILFLMPPSE